MTIIFLWFYNASKQGRKQISCCMMGSYLRVTRSAFHIVVFDCTSFRSCMVRVMLGGTGHCSWFRPLISSQPFAKRWTSLSRDARFVKFLKGLPLMQDFTCLCLFLHSLGLTLVWILFWHYHVLSEVMIPSLLLLIVSLRWFILFPVRRQHML